MLHVHNLSYTYARQKVPTLKELTFEIKQGEIFGFLGPSGAGKSTTQKILIGLLKNYQGEVHVFGRELKTWGNDYYERIGVSFELPNHYQKLTALENLEYFRSLYTSNTAQPYQLLQSVGLEQDANKLVAQFSKGMSIRLNLARALLNHPALLFLDEPTAGLDPVNAHKVKHLIRRKQEEGTTIFLTTHNMMVADELCDRVAFLIDGRIELIDTPRALKLRYGKRQICVEYGADDQRQSREFPLAGLGENQDFLTLLRQEPIQTLHSQETTLEKIFMSVTGRSLE
jgi:fluoroquinolone transport system ATP-binding protein